MESTGDWGGIRGGVIEETVLRLKPLLLPAHSLLGTFPYVSEIDYCYPLAISSAQTAPTTAHTWVEPWILPAACKPGLGHPLFYSVTVLRVNQGFHGSKAPFQVGLSFVWISASHFTHPPSLLLTCEVNLSPLMLVPSTQLPCQTLVQILISSSSFHFSSFSLNPPIHIHIL